MPAETKHKIVVIEDDDEVREALSGLLESAGHSVVASAESATAAELALREAAELVLCDVAMPVLDGYGVLKALRAEPATAGCPVVFVAAHGEVSDRVHAFKAGAVDYVTPPFARESLLRKVERILRAQGRRSGPPDASAERALPPLAEEPKPQQLPAQRPARHAVERDPPGLPAGSGTLPPFGTLPDLLRTVLIAEDNETFRGFLSQVMSRHGFTVYEAKDGEQALQLVLEKRPWLILADVNMPALDGFELCRRVRGASLISDRPFVFVSGWDDYRDRQRGLKLGGDDFISKQMPVRELLIRIHLLMQRYSEAGTFSPRKPVMEGSIEVVGTPALLQMWHQGRLSGECTLRSNSELFEARFREGEIVSAALGERSGADAVYAVLGWQRGSFRFVPGVVESGQPIAASFDQLLLEGCRLLDEERRSVGHAGGEPARSP